MKNITSKHNFILIKENKINEGIFGALKGLISGIGKMYNKVKGGKELTKIIEKYKVEIGKVFDKLTSAEQTSTASAKNVEAAIESRIYEAEGEESTSSESGAGLTTQAVDAKSQLNDEAKQNDHVNKQGEQEISVSKKRIEELKKSFMAEVDALKKRYTNKDGTVPKKFEYSIVLAKNTIADYVYEKWTEHFKDSGDSEAIQNIQKQRAQVAKQMKEGTEALKKLLEESPDKTKIEFAVGKKYKYTTENNKIITITIKEVDDDGNVTDAVTRNDDPINPVSERIENYYEIGKKYEYTNNDNKEVEVDITSIDDNTGNIKVKYVNSDGKESNFAVKDMTKLGYKVKDVKEENIQSVDKPQTQKVQVSQKTQAQPQAQKIQGQ
jgi:hypothetical protein